MYCKTFKSKTYQQIVVMRRQDKDGAPEVRLYFQPDGMGVCEFGIAVKDGEDASTRMDVVFENIKGNEAHELVYGYVRHMEQGRAN